MTIGLKRSVLRVVAALALIGSIANISQAATLTINAQGFYPNQTMVDASSGGLTLKSRIYMFFVTTDADILSVNQVQVTVTGGSLYQVAAPLGSNTEPPPPEPLASRGLMDHHSRRDVATRRRPSWQRHRFMGRPDQRRPADEFQVRADDDPAVAGNEP
jgi:hypothetical protein